MIHFISFFINKLFFNIIRFHFKIIKSFLFSDFFIMWNTFTSFHNILGLKIVSYNLISVRWGRNLIKLFIFLSLFNHYISLPKSSNNWHYFLYTDKTSQTDQKYNSCNDQCNNPSIFGSNGVLLEQLKRYLLSIINKSVMFKFFIFLIWNS